MHASFYCGESNDSKQHNLDLQPVGYLQSVLEINSGPLTT